MEADTKVLLGLIGAAFTIFTAMIKVRGIIDEKRDKILNLNGGEQEGLETEHRLYLLDKDISEYITAMVIIMLVIGIALYATALNLDPEKVSLLLIIVTGLFGFFTIVGSYYTFKSGVYDYNRWKEWIQTGKIPDKACWLHAVVGDLKKQLKVIVNAK